MEQKPNLKRCPKCGAAIPAEAPQGLCPKCLLAEVSVPTGAGAELPAKAVPPSQDALTAAFPQLEIVEMIGQGGMGFVFKARQPKLERFVALKILPESLAADAAFAERFTREGRVLARLNHPNIVTIHDFGQANGFFYLLMEYVDGVNLRQAMQAGRFTPEQALAVVPKICDALQFAHAEGILHRDIKPENILLDGKGRVKIADFGIAKILGKEISASSESSHAAAESHLTGAIGTPQYMAPEQVVNPRQVDQRADIYSLGVVFYEMLTGELPLGRFAPPSQKAAVDPRLDEVVSRALEKEPDRRTPTALAVKTQVESIAHSAPAPAGQGSAGFPRPTGERVRRSIFRAGQAGLITFLLVVLATAIISFLLPKTYVATSRVVIRDQQLPFDPYRLQTEFAKIESPNVLLKVAESLDLPSRWASRYRAGSRLDDATTLNLLRGALEMRNSHNTPVVELRYFSDSPAEAAAIANTLAEVLREGPNGARFSIVETASVPTRAVRPNLPLNLAVGVIAGAIAGVLGGIAAGLYTFLKPSSKPGAERDQSNAAAATNFWKRPRRLQIVAVLFLIGGALSIWNVVEQAQVRNNVFNPMILGVPVAVGLLRRRPLWRKVGLGLLACCLMVLIVAPIMFLAFGGGSGTHWLNGATVEDFASLGISSLIWTVSLFLAGLALLVWASFILLRPEIRTLFKQTGFCRPWIEWTALLAAFSIALLARNVPRPSPESTFAMEPAHFPELAKVVEFSKVTAGSDRVSAWTDSEIAPGEKVVPVLRKVDGASVENMTQRITRHGPERAQTTTVFSWIIPSSFGADSVKLAQEQLRSQHVGRALRLEVGEPLTLFALTNEAGGIIQGSLEFVPLPANAFAPGEPIEGAIRFTAATNVSNMVLAYFTPLIPPGHHLEAGATLTGSPEPNVITSVAHSSTYNAGDFRWDFPPEFTQPELEFAAQQVLDAARAPLPLPSGERTRVFSVTNNSGAVYEGFVELLAPLNRSAIPGKRLDH